MSSKSIIIVDDDRGLVPPIRFYVPDSDITAFTLPSEALEYLSSLEAPPFFTYVDMNPYGDEMSEFEKRPQDFPEASVPREIGEYFISRGWEDRFTFMSNNVSYHDIQILRKTGASFVKKEYYPPNRRIFSVTEHIKKILGRPNCYSKISSRWP